jgi:diguanylate cyclase (GGDEF)-like protein
MSLPIDEPTLMTVLGIASLTASVMFFVLAAFARQLPGVRAWAIGSFAVGFATIIDGPRLITDWQLASVFFNIPFSVGQVFILAGTMQFCARPGASTVLRAGTMLGVAMVLFFTYIVPDATWRIVTISAFQVVLNVWTGIILWRYPDAFARRAFHVGSIVVVFQGVTAFAQGLLILFSSFAITYGSPQFPLANIISWVGAMTNVLIGNWMFFMLIMLRLVADLRTAAERDVLTGLLNRRGLRPRIDSMLRRAHGGRVGVMILDIDHFKTINDKFGHEVGDKVLVIMGEILRNLNVPNSSPCRWGGEEFCVVVEGQGAPFLIALAESVRAQFQQRTAAMGCLDTGRTVSVGISLTPLHPDFEMSTAISVADAQLYKAKEGGRDRVMIAEPQPAMEEEAKASAA